MKNVAIFSFLVLAVSAGRPSKPRFHDKLGTNVDVDLLPGQTAKLGCKIKAKPKVTTTWTKDGEQIPRSKGRIAVTKNQLLIRDAGAEDVGVYKCHGGNRFGFVERVFMVNVDGMFTSGENSLETIDDTDDSFDDEDDVRRTVKNLTDEILTLKNEVAKMARRGMINVHVNKQKENDNGIRDIMSADDDDEEFQKHINLNFHVNGGESYANDKCLVQETHAHCEFFANQNYDSGDNVTGYIHFIQKRDGPVVVNIMLRGFAAPFSSHGLHVHEFGDASNSCDSVGSHFNPYGLPHGSKDGNIRHVGDLGNIQGDEKGQVTKQMVDDMVKLYGSYSIIGRSVVIHQKLDDLGTGGNPGSVLSGNAGSRVACCIIGHGNRK